MGYKSISKRWSHLRKSGGKQLTFLLYMPRSNTLLWLNSCEKDKLITEVDRGCSNPVPLTHTQSSLVISKLDYCNSLLTGLPACSLKPLQLIQNAAARLQSTQIFSCFPPSPLPPLAPSCCPHWIQNIDAGLQSSQRYGTSIPPKLQPHSFT